MFEDLMKEFNEQRNKLIDKLTLELLKRADIPLSENYTNFELFMAMQDLKAGDYEIKFRKNVCDNNWLCLYRKDRLIYGYEFSIRAENNKIIMMAIPIE